MKDIDFVLKIESHKKGIEGIEFLRDAVNWMDNRNEFLNESKSPKQLLKDYMNFLNTN